MYLYYLGFSRETKYILKYKITNLKKKKRKNGEGVGDPTSASPLNWAGYLADHSEHP